MELKHMDKNKEQDIWKQATNNLITILESIILATSDQKETPEETYQRGYEELKQEGLSNPKNYEV